MCVSVCMSVYVRAGQKGVGGKMNEMRGNWDVMLYFCRKKTCLFVEYQYNEYRSCIAATTIIRAPS